MAAILIRQNLGRSRREREALTQGEVTWTMSQFSAVQVHVGVFCSGTRTDSCQMHIQAGDFVCTVADLADLAETSGAPGPDHDKANACRIKRSNIQLKALCRLTTQPPTFLPWKHRQMNMRPNAPDEDGVPDL